MLISLFLVELHNENYQSLKLCAIVPFIVKLAMNMFKNICEKTGTPSRCSTTGQMYEFASRRTVMQPFDLQRRGDNLKWRQKSTCRLGSLKSESLFLVKIQVQARVAAFTGRESI